MTLMTNIDRMKTKIAVWRFSRFRDDEDGGMIIFSLILFVLILTFGGMAVDLMRFETTRAQLQGTLDRATLAAADLDQTLPPADVVTDYFTKAGMVQFLDGAPIVDEGINYRRVTANAEADIPLFFYDLPRVFMSPFNAGLTALTVSGSSTAEERVSDVEVSLVLDVSSSMNSNSRMTNLRPAAREFVTTVLANNTNAPQGLITISMIPYSAVVNPGPRIAAEMTFDRAHNYSHCALFEATDFDDTAIDLDHPYDHVGHFDYGSATNIYAQPIERPWCFTGTENAIVLHSSSEAYLHQEINALEAFGNTAIDLGMKWATGLLDESTQDLVTGLTGGNPMAGDVSPVAAGRPYSYEEPDILKVIVLMTDGANTTEYDLDDYYYFGGPSHNNSFDFKNGPSPFWFNRQNSTQRISNVPHNRISYQYEGLETATRWDDEFYNLDEYNSNRWRNYPDGFSSRNEYINAITTDPTPADPDEEADAAGLGVNFGNVVHASWQDMFAEWVHYRINNELMGRVKSHGAIDNNEFRAPDYADVAIVNGSQADSRLSDICEAARDEGIIIYTVAFEAPSGGQAALRDCASSPTHYFDVDGTDISEAFSAIASDIRALKLTQ